MTGREIIFAVVIAAVAASLLLDILGLVLHTLPNFLRRAKIKENPVNPDSAVMAMVLKDMQFLGLTKLKPDKEISLAPEVQVGEMPAMSGAETTLQRKNAAEVWPAPAGPDNADVGPAVSGAGAI